MEALLLHLPTIFSFTTGILIAFGLAACCSYVSMMYRVVKSGRKIRGEDYSLLFVSAGTTIFWSVCLFLVPEWTAVHMHLLLIAQAWCAVYLLHITNTIFKCAVFFNHALNNKVAIKTIKR